MSQPSVELTREGLETLPDASNARDWDTIVELLGLEVEFNSVVGAADGERSYHGIEGLRAWAEQVDAVWEDWRQEVVEFHDVSDNQAAAVIPATGRARASGVPLDTRTGNVITWTPGKGWRLQAYSDPREAFEAAGFQE
jgi:ketosteroid isomerase-like protein